MSLKPASRKSAVKSTRGLRARAPSAAEPESEEADERVAERGGGSRAASGRSVRRRIPSSASAPNEKPAGESGRNVVANEPGGNTAANAASRRSGVMERPSTLRTTDQKLYNGVLRWFRVKRTVTEMILDRGYGGEGNKPPADDAFDLEDDTDIIYYKGKIKIGYDAEWERDKLDEFHARYTALAKQLEDRIAELPKSCERRGVGDVTHRLLKWETFSYVDAMSNVYYNRERDCYLYVRFTDGAYKDSQALSCLLEEQKSSLPVRYPGYKLAKNSKNRFLPSICHTVYVFSDDERGNKTLKKAFELMESEPKARTQFFFAGDLVFDLAHHYLSPGFKRLEASGCGCGAITRQRKQKTSPKEEEASCCAEAPKRTVSAAVAPKAPSEASAVNTHTPYPEPLPSLEADTGETSGETEETCACVDNDIGPLALPAGLNKHDLPLILSKDPIVKRLGARPGDVIVTVDYPTYNSFVPVVTRFRRVQP